MPQLISRIASSLARRPVLLLVTLYVAIGAIAAITVSLLPAPLDRAVEALTGGRGLGAFESASFGRGASRLPLPEAPMWAIATLAMFGAGLLALPVAWLYTITRQKRGYRQSVVQSLILLPVVVAGVVVLVKFSLALAFSLAGIVAAVRFRNTLEDSKDAVYIFVVTGIGLAAGVELTVALALSLVFNLVTVLLFEFDFGRTPARLEGEMAQAHLRRALATANRTSQFVARLDREVLEQLAPEQLEALADRAWRRRKDAEPDTGEDEGPRHDTVLRVRTDGSAGSREAVELALVRHAKSWHLERSETAAEGGQVIEYALKLRKSVKPTSFLDSVRAEGGSGVLDAELK